MRHRILAPPAVAAGYRDIPDHRDREEAREIIASLAEGAFPPAPPEAFVDRGMTWTRYTVMLSSGRGFVSYSIIFTEDGEPAVLLWPVVWCDV